MEEYINLALYTQVVVEGIAVKVAKLRGVTFQSGASKRYGNVGFDKSRFFEGHQALETLDKKYYIFVINVFAHRHYLAFFMCLIKMQVKIAEICLIPHFGGF